VFCSTCELATVHVFGLTADCTVLEMRIAESLQDILSEAALRLHTLHTHLLVVASDLAVLLDGFFHDDLAGPLSELRHADLIAGNPAKFPLQIRHIRLIVKPCRRLHLLRHHMLHMLWGAGVTH
jgi:hypothetical protein